MRIRVPFEYSAKVVKKGHRNPESRDFWEWTLIDIPEMSDADAPVATRWFDEIPDLRSLSAMMSWGTPPRDGICETRWFDDNHWWPLLQKDSLNYKLADRVHADTLSVLGEIGINDSNPLMLPLYRRPDSETGNPLVPEEYRTVVACNRDEVLEALHQKAASFIIVDGMVWQRGAEPVCHLKECVEVGTDYQMVIKMVPSDSLDIKDPRSAYRADRFDEAVQTSFLGMGDRDAASINDKRRVTVFIPESIQYRDEERALEHSALKVLNWYSDRRLKEMPDELGIGWFKLRACYKDNSLSGEDRAEALADALSHFAELPMDRDAQSTAKTAVNRWRSRPITMEIEDELGVPGMR